jgi:hypothetical protein
MTDLQYRFVIGLLVPIALAALGILAKKVSRGVGGGWRRSDFYLGREFSLAGVATAITSILVIWLKPNRVFQGRADLGILGENFTTVFVGFLLYMLIIGMHQDYEDENHTGPDRSRELKLIGIVSNVIGFGLLVAAVALMVD